MTDRVVIYNRQGIPIGEVDATVVRAWILERKTRAERAVLAVRASAVNRDMTRFRNLVVVYSNVVPTWCGVIWDTRDWEDNYMTLTVYSCEYLLSMRRTNPVDKFVGQPGLVFSGLLKVAQQLEGLLIWADPNMISNGGRATEKEYNRANVFEAINDLAAEAEFYWWLEPLISSANRLLLRAQWQKSRGVYYHRPLVQGSNFVDVKVTEICQVANRIYALGDFEDWNTPLEYIAQDAQSRSDYGLIESTITDHDANDPDEVTTIGTAELTKYKQPRVRISGKVLTTPYPKIGDNVHISLSADSLGYAGGQTVATPLAGLRVKSVSYSPEEDAVNIMCDNLFWET